MRHLLCSLWTCWDTTTSELLLLTVSLLLTDYNSDGGTQNNNCISDIVIFYVFIGFLYPFICIKCKLSSLAMFRFQKLLAKRLDRICFIRAQPLSTEMLCDTIPIICLTEIILMQNQIKCWFVSKSSWRHSSQKKHINYLYSNIIVGSNMFKERSLYTFALFRES